MEAIYSAFCLIYLSASSPFNARDMHVEKAKTGESTARGGLSRDLFELPFLSQMPKDGENVFFFSPRFMSAYYPRDSREPQTAHRLISRPRTKEEKVQIAASGHLLKSFSQKKGPKTRKKEEARPENERRAGGRKEGSLGLKKCQKVGKVRPAAGEKSEGSQKISFVPTFD